MAREACKYGATQVMEALQQLGSTPTRQTRVVRAGRGVRGAAKPRFPTMSEEKSGRTQEQPWV